MYRTTQSAGEPVISVRFSRVRPRTRLPCPFGLSEYVISLPHVESNVYMFSSVRHSIVFTVIGSVLHSRTVRTAAGTFTYDELLVSVAAGLRQ